MLQGHTRREALKQKAQQEKDELSQHHLITTASELHQALLSIDAESVSTAKKRAKKLSLLKLQINIRKKVLGQNIRIVFSHARKQRPLSDVVKELSDYINENPLESSEFIREPYNLIGRHIRHRFEIDANQTKWYNGIVLGYNTTSKTHEIKYNGEEHCNFDLTLDLINGDFEVLDDP